MKKKYDAVALEIAAFPKSRKFKDLTGNIFGNYKVLAYAGKIKTQHRFHCECRCGVIKTVLSGSLVSGKSKSCGCLNRERLGNITRKHGKRSMPEYHVWCGMKDRCYNPNSDAYKNYGARGIDICIEWLNSFSAFITDMGNRPTSLHSIDRINNNKGYSPENCRWATRKIQNSNTRNIFAIEWQGKKQSATLWAKEIGINPATLTQRISKLKWTTEKALTTPTLRKSK